MNNSLIINNDSKIYVACPANIATGGPELLHQLVYELSLLGVDAYMYYYNTTDSVSPIHDAYKKYQNKYVNIIDDNKKNYIIVPEAYCAIQILNSFNAINKIIWTFTNLFPGCLMKSIDGIRMKKKFFWDQTKLANRHWLSVNMTTEALLGFKAFNEKKKTGKDVIDFIKYRQLLSQGHAFDQELIDKVLPKPK